MQEKAPKENSKEYLPYIAEVSNVLLNAGNILITAIDHLKTEDINAIGKVVDFRNLKLVWIGDVEEDTPPIDIHVEENEPKEVTYEKVKKTLIDNRVIFQGL